MKADKLIDDANELLMQLRIKSEKERINEKQLYDVQMLLYKALDKLRQLTVIKEEEFSAMIVFHHKFGTKALEAAIYYGAFSEFCTSYVMSPQLELLGYNYACPEIVEIINNSKYVGETV